MKVLYAIQGTGNGHLSRACELIPVIKKYADVSVLLSGYQSDITAPFNIDYKLYGLSFIFGKKGNVDILQTIKRLKPIQFFKDLKSVPVESFDLVINDFEPVTAWACKKKGIPCIGLSHQSAVLHPNAPKPAKSDLLGKFILKNYAPTSTFYGFHFEEYDTNIATPVIRKDIQKTIKQKEEHITVYLPSYDDNLLISIFNKIPEVKWHIFSKHSNKNSEIGNVHIKPVNHTEFAESMKTCNGIFCGAGFETPAEALYLGKNLLVIPMKNQYEQQCNAAALKKMGVPVIYSISEKEIDFIRNWALYGKTIKVKYTDNNDKIIQKIFSEHSQVISRQ